MQSLLSRWLMFALLIAWALSHATVFGQSGKTPTSAADKLRDGLDKVVTFDYTGQSLNDALNHFRDKTGVTISVDQVAFMNVGMDVNGPIGQVELRAKNQKAGAALRKLLNAYRLTYVIFEDSVLITTEEMALMRQFRQRVTVDVSDVPLKKAVGDLARKQGINLVIDPAVDNAAKKSVTLQIDNTGIETALRLLAELADVKAVRMGNVMFVTTAAKAKSIREEEAHQIDNPMNPNLPISSPPMFGGFGGGGNAAPGFPGPMGQPTFPQRVRPDGTPARPGIDAPMPDQPPPPPPAKRPANPDGTTSSPPQPPRR